MLEVRSRLLNSIAKSNIESLVNSKRKSRSLLSFLSLTSLAACGGGGQSPSPTTPPSPPNNAPTDITLSAVAIDENTSVATDIGTVSGTDADTGDTLSFTVSDNRFEVVNGTLRLKASASLDHEFIQGAGTDATIDIVITVTDGHGGSYTESFTITVNDINDAPSDLDMDSFDVNENEAGAIVGTLSVVDQDEVDSFTYEVSDDRFEIVDGQLKLKDQYKLDFEAENEISIEVTVTDAAGATYSEIFTINVVDVDDEPDIEVWAANSTTTGQIQVGEVITGAVNTNGDVDWLAVELVAGETYEINLQSVDFDTYFQGIYDADAVAIAGTTNDDGGDGLNSRMVFTATTTGTYFLSARAFSGTGEYNLSINNVNSPVDLIVNDISTSSYVSVGNVFSGMIDNAGDVDWIAVTLQAGQEYNIQMLSTGMNAEIGGIYDSEGNLIANSGNDDFNQLIDIPASIFTPETTGTYYIAMQASDDIDTGQYIASVSEVDSAQMNGIIDTALNSQLDGLISVELTAGNTYRFDMVSDTFDTVIIGIQNDTNEYIMNTFDDDWGLGLNSTVTFSPSVSGTYYILTSAYEEDGIGTYNYSLEVTETSGLTVRVDEIFTSSLSSSEFSERVSIELEAGHTYQVYLVSGDFDTVINNIYNSSGIAVAGTYDDDGGSNTNSLVTFTPSVSGTYEINVDSYSAGDSGSYIVAVFDATDWNWYGTGTDDVFEFGSSLIDNVIIVDFEDGSDLIDLSNTGLVFSDLTVSQSGSDTIVSDNLGNVITIEDISSGAITESDFIFG